MAKNPVSATTEPAMRPTTTGSVKPDSWARVSPNIIDSSPTQKAVAPAKSKRSPPSGATSGTKRHAVQVPMIPTGRLTRKIHRQLNASMINPPAAGPMATPMDTMEPASPSALPRSEGGNASVRMAKPRAKIIADPIPWTMRNPISQPTPGASPHRVEATVNTANPAV